MAGSYQAFDEKRRGANHWTHQPRNTSNKTVKGQRVAILIGHLFYKANKKIRPDWGIFVRRIFMTRGVPTLSLLHNITPGVCTLGRTTQLDTS